MYQKNTKYHWPIAHQYLNYLTIGLIDKGYNPEFGARPLRRAIEHYIEDPLSEGTLRGEFKDKNLIKIDVLDEEHLKFDGVKVKEEKPKKKEKVAAQ